MLKAKLVLFLMAVCLEVTRPALSPLVVVACADEAQWTLVVLNGLGELDAARHRNDLVPVVNAKASAVPVDAAMSGRWNLQLGSSQPLTGLSVRFGDGRGIPLAGDFNGDGADELAVFLDGVWQIDFNGDEAYTDADLKIQFGTTGDRPLVGDWDGDGKTDIGIVKRIISTNSTSVNSLSRPAALELCIGRECYLLAVTQRSTASGNSVGIPVSGDWDGKGAELPSAFCDGQWTFKMAHAFAIDCKAQDFRLGQHGDLPVTGDFNRDGRIDFGVYRRGQWHIDTSGDGRFGDGDLFFELGDADDLPVVGDWDGDGRDQAGILLRGSGSELTGSPAAQK